MRGASAVLQNIGAVLRLGAALIVLGIVVVVVIASISGGGSSKHRTSRQRAGHAHAISVTSTCADWAKASETARLTFGGAAAAGNARAVVLSIGLFCLKAKLHHRDLARVPITAAPVLSGH